MLELLLPALMPAIGDGVKSLIHKFTGSDASPKTVDEAIKLRDADIRRLETLARLDAPGGNMSRWVQDLRGSSRYLLAFAIIGYGIVVQFTDAPPAVVANAQLLMGSVFSFMFGDRMYLHLKRGG